MTTSGCGKCGECSGVCTSKPTDSTGRNIIPYKMAQSMHKAVNKGLRAYVDLNLRQGVARQLVLNENPYKQKARKQQWYTLANVLFNTCVDLINAGSMKT